MTSRGSAVRLPATEQGIARLARQLVEILGSPSFSLEGAELDELATGLRAGGLSTIEPDGRAGDVAVSLGAADGSSIDTARAFVAGLSSRAALAVVFTPKLIDTRSNQWWDELFADEGFEPADVLRTPLWNDASWDAHGLTGLTLYVRRSERSVLDRLTPTSIPRSAVHPGVVGEARRSELSAYKLVDRLDLFDPLIEDPIETLQRAFERNAREVEVVRHEAEAAAVRSQEQLENALADLRAVDAARAWEADGRARAEDALARAEEESAVLRREIAALVADSSAALPAGRSVSREFSRRAASAVLRRLQRRGLQAADRLSSGLPGRPGIYGRRAVAVYRSMMIDWLEATRVLFDTDHYLAQRPGLIGSGIDPVVHYAHTGWRQGLDPHPLFDTDWYVRTNARLLPTNTSPLEHYVSRGWREGCNPHPLFDTDFYVRRAVHVAVDDEVPLMHYVTQGWREGLDPHPIFETRRYLESYPDVEASGVCPLVHYVLFGWQLGYQPGVLFDADWYLEHHPEAVASGLPAYRYYLEIGIQRGDRPSPWSDQLDAMDGGSEAPDHVAPS